MCIYDENDKVKWIFNNICFVLQGSELTEKTKENESLKLNNKNLDEKLIDLTRQNSGMLFSKTICKMEISEI